MLLIFCLGGKLFAQVPDSLGSRVSKKDISLVSDGPSEVISYKPFGPEGETVFSDTLINGEFYFFDPIRSRELQYGHLGNTGSAAQFIEFGLLPKYGTRTGLNGYQIYTKTAEDLRIFKSKRAFTDLFYSQGNEQNDHIFKGSLGRSFNNGFSISVEHERIIHSLDDEDLPFNRNAFYASQGAKNTNLLIGIAYAPKDKKYNAHLGYIHNEIQQRNHGGINSNDPGIFASIMEADSLDDEYTIPVELSDANALTRYVMRTLEYKHSYDLFQLQDSLKTTSSKIKLNHAISWSWDTYKFSDDAPSSNFYGDFLVDDRGVRMFLKTNSLENHAYITWKNSKDRDKGGVYFEAGLKHDAFKIKQEFSDSLVQNLYAEGVFKSNFLGLVDLDLFGQIGLLDNAGDFRIMAKAALLTNKIGDLSASLQQQRYSPDLLHTQLYVSQANFWQNDFNKPFDSELSFKYSLPSFKFSAQLSYFLLDNFIYFDEEIKPVQFNGLINLVQLNLRKDFQFGIFRMENRFTLQNSSEKDITNLPRWSSMNSIAIQGKIFKKVLDTRFGFDLRINETYNANAFFPLLSQFYIQNKKEVAFYPALDAGISFKVDSFRFFFRMENLTSFISKDVFSQVPFYLQKEQAIRFGVGWQFYDRHGDGN